MARVNSLLSIVAAQNANELRLASDADPRIYAHGAEKQLLLAKTSDAMVRELLGDILVERSTRGLLACGRAEVIYDAGELGTFNVTLSAYEGGGVAATFVKSSARAVVPRDDAPLVAPVRSSTRAPVADAPAMPLARSSSARASG